MDITFILNQADNQPISFIKDYGSVINYIGHSIITIFIAWLVAYLALNRYFQGQKTERLQKIYYEDAIIKPLNHLEKLFSLVNKNGILFGRLNQYIGNKFKTAEEISKKSATNETREAIFKKITSSKYIKSIVEKINVPAVRFAPNDSLKEILKKTTNSDSVKYFSAWFNKDVKEDISIIMGIIRNIAANCEDYLTTDQEYITLTEFSIEKNLLHINNAMTIIEKHQILIYLASQLKHILVEKHYRNKKSLVKDLKKDSEFSALINNFTEAFKILFLYYHDGKSYISYAKNKAGKNYKITFTTDANQEEIAHIEEITYPGKGELQELDIFHEITISREKIANKTLHQELFNIAEPLKNI